MTAPPPGTAPRVRPAYSATTIIIAALAAALTLSTIVAVGWSTSSEMRARLRASDIMPYPIAAPQWAQGAAQAWSSTVAADAEIIHAGDRVIVLERSSNKDPEAVLTSYAITDTGLNQEWMSTADLSKGTVDDPEFLLWNGDLVRGSTLIDLDTGESSQAPWGENAMPHLANRLLITCEDSGSCSAWSNEDGITTVWTTSIEPRSGAKYSDMYGALTVHERSGTRYIRITPAVVVDLDTGRKLDLQVPAVDYPAIISLSDGWAVLAKDSEDRWVIHTYSLGSKKSKDSFPSALPLTSSEALIYAPKPRPLTDIDTIWKKGDVSIIPVAASLDSNGCATELKVSGGPSMTLPSLSQDSDTVLSSRPEVCLKEIRVNTDASIITVGAQDQLDPSSFVLMYDASSGEQINFDGIDPAAGGNLMLIDSSTIVGYDPVSGTVRSFKPSA